MTESDNDRDRTLKLDAPDPPANLTYADYEDFRYRELVKLNRLGLSQDALIAALQLDTNVLQAAAAHTLGSESCTESRPALQALLPSTDDLVKVEAAYALARMGFPEGQQALVACLDYSIDAYLCPAIAAGYLARLGDPQGFATLVRCLGSDIMAIRVLASKQLFFFAPFDGTQDAQGNAIDVFGQYERALRDADGNVRWQALVQLRDIQSSMAKKVLERFVESTQDAQLRDSALAMLHPSG